MRWTMRTGLLSASKLTIRSTSPMSSPSSAMHVATRQLNSPAKNALTTAWEKEIKKNKKREDGNGDNEGGAHGI